MKKSGEKKKALIVQDETRPKHFWQRSKPKTKIRFLWLKKFCLDTPQVYKRWTTLYFGERGAGKTVHQSKESLRVLMWYKKLYSYYPDIHRGIVFSNQHFSQFVIDEYGDNGKYGNYLYHWDEISELHYCPRKDCWRGKKKHLLHGAVVIFDDVSIVLDPSKWQYTPTWLKKYFFLGRHFGIHILGSLVDPFAVDVSFRRCVDMTYQFADVWSTRDPDDTRPPLGFVAGIYRRRKVDAKTLWQQGNLPEEAIRMMLMAKEQQDEQLKEMGRKDLVVKSDNWFGSLHLFNWNGRLFPFGFRIFNWMMFKPIAACNVYDTLQNVKEFEPQGLICQDIKCIEKKHIHPWDYPNFTPHELKKKYGIKYCDKIKRIYEVI
jgi:hypothetical protein